MKRSPDETAEKTTDLVPQPNGGALKKGGTPGNKGGRPPSQVRRALLKSFEQRIPALKRIADGKDAKGKAKDTSDSDRLRAIEMMARYGFGPSVSLDEVREKLRATIVLAESMLDHDRAEEFIDSVRKIWLGEY